MKPNPSSISTNTKFETGQGTTPGVLTRGGRRNATPLCGTTAAPTPVLRGSGGLSARDTICSVVAVIVVLLTLAIPARAQTNYTIDWFTVDGGGGTSTGGVYSISGTIGQPDAGGPMTNGQYSVTGGFWALPVAVQDTNAPTLTIVPAGPGQATISWTPDTGTNWVLQETLGLSPAAWADSPSGATNPVVVPATLPTKFYRLHKP